MLAALGKSLLLGRKKKKSKSGKEMSQKVLNRSNKEDEKPTIKPQSSLVPLSIKTTMIPTANLITTKEDSVKDKLLMIKDLLGLQLKFRLSSFSQKIKNMREERRKKREKELEENKEKKKKSFSLNILPKTGILDSLKNFLTFLAGGFLLNLLLNQLERIRPIVKRLAPIAKGIMQFGKFMWDGVIGFIVQAYDKYDELRESVEKMGGEEALEKFDELSDLLKTVINGAIIAATVALVTRPFLKKGCLPTPNNLRNNRNPNIKNNKINNRRTTSGGQQLNRGRFSGMKESLRNIRNRIPFLNPNVSQGSNVVNRNLSKLNPVNPKISKGSNIFTRNLSKLNPFNNKITGSKPSFKLPKIPKIPGLGMLGKSLGKFLGPLFFAIDFGGRKGEGQTNIQAGAGAGAAQAGFWSGSAVAAKLLSPLLVTPVPGARILYGVSVFGAGILGSMGLTSVTDTITGANKDVSKKESIFEVSSSGSDETAVNLLKNIKSIDDLATNTSYSQGSYGLITEINNFIQPVVQEV